MFANSDKETQLLTSQIQLIKEKMLFYLIFCNKSENVDIACSICIKLRFTYSFALIISFKHVIQAVLWYLKRKEHSCSELVNTVIFANDKYILIESSI